MKKSYIVYQINIIDTNLKNKHFAEHMKINTFLIGKNMINIFAQNITLTRLYAHKFCVVLPPDDDRFA